MIAYLYIKCFSYLIVKLIIIYENASNNALKKKLNEMMRTSDHLFEYVCLNLKPPKLLCKLLTTVNHYL